MTPQINLVNPDLIPTQAVFPLKSVVQALGFIALGLSLLVWFAQNQVQQLQLEAEASQQRLSAQKDRITRLAEVVGLRKPNPEVAAQLLEIQNEKAALKQINELLHTGGTPGTANGYSNHLYGLAQQTTPGVWLTGLAFHNNQMSLEGMALNADVLPSYLNVLQKVPSLKGQSFSIFEMKKDEEPKASPTLSAKDHTVVPLKFRLGSTIATPQTASPPTP